MTQPPNSIRKSLPATPDDSRSELRTIEQAARHRWPVPDQLREAAVTRLAMILADSKQPPRMQVAAIRVLVELDKANLMYEQLELDRDPDTRRPVVNVTTGIDLADLRQMDDHELRQLLAHRSPEAGLRSDLADESP